MWTLLLILLLPPAIEIAAGVKPDKPGKPEKPPPETATFRISIGVKVGEDVVLTEPEYFDVVTPVDGWVPKGKGKPQMGSWGIPILEDRYGYYTMQSAYSEENDTYLTDFYNGELAQLFGFEHRWSLSQRAKEDYWRIGINWTSDFNGDGEPDPLILEGWTDRGPEGEGIYDSENDIWTVTFTTTNAYFIVFWCEVNDEGTDCWLYWCGCLEFTVTIQKI